MCFGDWSRQDFILNAELVELLRDTGKGKGKGKANTEEDDDDIFFVGDELLL
ncbi:hypothetical protein BT96DRAFT_928822 [Gymnopus androsaceus JB14]|uniref:Uncharacterized protein n=1 Tax=Gymnopus androsaceus JB14 TaxID=1447944 RepID=A0A6A4GJ30_9AGAR|nr:hypothetical protein BT96DRAFT_928822 [Gymnopus androsaceus JB14]